MTDRVLEVLLTNGMAETFGGDHSWSGAHEPGFIVISDKDGVTVAAYRLDWLVGVRIKDVV